MNTRLHRALAALLLLAWSAPARAVMDIDDRGPVLQAGNFAMRVTNIGVLGNAFFDKGLSFDPSFEFPRGSGHECLNHAELWVGARTPQGALRVSGGPMLEWRPTLDPADRVRTAWAGQPGSRRLVDDDGDGRVDEETLNGRDDDGDGEIDEDLSLPSQEVMAADYTDDQPAAINYGYPTGETHVPLHLAVHQEAYAWSAPGADRFAGVTFTISNIGVQRQSDVYVGVLADLDSRLRSQPGGHLNDRMVWRTYARTLVEGVGTTKVSREQYLKTCVVNLTRPVPTVEDGLPNSGLPASAIIPLAHTTDPLAYLTNTAFPGVTRLAEFVRAPAQDTTFRYSVFANDMPPGQGGVPQLDAERYAALQGRYREAPPDRVGDPVILVRCGPFAHLDPGQSIEVTVAFVAATEGDSLTNAMADVAQAYNGARLNRLPDDPSLSADQWNHGDTGINGHEVCIEAPEGVTFNYEPHCPDKVGSYKGELADLCYSKVVLHLPLCPAPDALTPAESTYTHGRCVWTDADCSICTGYEGKETRLHWLDPGIAPPAPAFRVLRGDHAVTVRWDNEPEILLHAGIAGSPGYTFAGYHVYRLSDWSRETLLPPPSRWQLVAAFGTDTTQRELPLSMAVDSTVDWDLIQYGEHHYPVGRYRLVDNEVLNGFDYLYVVTALVEQRFSDGHATRVVRLESPLIASIDSIVVPHAAARPASGQVWVVPNPFRASAPWDRQPVPGDPFGRHLDFFGLPKSRSTIRIYTVAGDLVAELPHDGSAGDGQASWNLISRNGQDIESGIYLFTVDSPLGHQVGRFVVIR